jgi:hypothetical protein
MLSAARGDRARDEIIVATMLLESWMPFRKSKIKAKIMTAITSGVMNVSLSGDFDDDVSNHVRGLISAIRGIAEVTIDLAHL